MESTSFNNSTLTPTFTLNLPSNNTCTFFGKDTTDTFNMSNGSGTMLTDSKNFSNLMLQGTIKSNASNMMGKSVKQSKNMLGIIGDSVEDDVHVAVSCLRALMNNKFGLNIVFNNQQAIYCIVRSILHHSLRYSFVEIFLKN